MRLRHYLKIQLPILFLFVLLSAGFADADSSMIRGKVMDDSSAMEKRMPPSSERAGAIPGASGILTPSEIKEITESAVTLPTSPAKVEHIQRDEAGSAFFESGSDTLTERGKASLDNLMKVIANKQNIRIYIVGHTDNGPIAKPETKRRFPDNKALSDARALTVAAYMKAGLILPSSALSAEGKGETAPIADNGTVEGRANNRRVEIKIWYEETLKKEASAEQTKTTAVKKERELCGPDSAGTQDIPFRITVDGVPVVDDGKRPEADRQRCVDVGLEKADIQVRYDPLQISPALNIWTTPNGVLRGKQVAFFTYTNYSPWIRKSEVRVFLKDQNTQQKPYAVIPVNINESALWSPPVDAPDELFFLFRVYDEKGRFDETIPKQLTLLTRSKPSSDMENKEREELIGYGENSRKVLNIPVKGGTITVNGKNIGKGNKVTIFGIQVPVDKAGSFAFRQIVPAGPQTIEVAIKDEQGGEKLFRRNLSIAADDWFYIAIADLTIGRDATSGPAKLVTDDTKHYNGREYIDGRGAFYLKGTIKGEYILTASVDTRERPLKDLFSNFDSKDPEYLLRRIDPDKFYPVYGDDSTIVDDAPTQGKFYVRIEKGDSYIMWGNFMTQWTGTELTQYSRGLYGANLFWLSEDTTKYGEKRAALNAFAAQPGTLASREEFRGTGGSLYYLRHIDITQGSDRLWIEIRDKDSLMVLERRELNPIEDYDINYIQGRIMLRVPLPSVADGGGLVQNGSLNGNPVYLIATYEYVPGFEALNTVTAGGRASLWVNDHFRFGVTAFSQGEDQEKQELRGADMIIRYKPGTYLKAEVAQSQGPGNGTFSSMSGGFDFNEKTGIDEKASAWRIEGTADFSEVWDDMKGKVRGYVQRRERGFSGPGQITDTGEAMTQTGIQAEVPIGDTVKVELKGDYRDSESQKSAVFEGAVKKQLNEEWSIAVGGRYDDRDVYTPNASPILSQDGNRTDVVVWVDYKPLAEMQGPPEEGAQEKPFLNYKPWNIYKFVQGTIYHTGDRSENNRAGIGGTWQITDRFKAGAEVSGGNEGLGGKVSGDYRIDDRSNVYLSYIKETEEPGLNIRGTLGTGILGSKYKINDRMSVFGETRFTNGYSSSLTHAFGLDLAPNDRWTYGFKFETGKLSDELAGDLRRLAFGIATSYKYEKTKYSGVLEYRRDYGTGGDRTVWLVKNALGQQVDPSWRLLGKLNFSLSESSNGAFYDGDFVEFVAGAAYRPVTNDKWNTLSKYTYFYNLPSPGQVASGNSSIADYSQRSHVLSVDTIYDMVPWVSLGFKYGLRYSQLRQSRTDGDWFSSTAHLLVARADFHIVHKWDALIEARQLTATEIRNVRSGFLVAIYRHINKNVKFGMGYNFTNFSDNLTDLSYRSRGFFVNIISTL